MADAVEGMGRMRNGLRLSAAALAIAALSGCGGGGGGAISTPTPTPIPSPTPAPVPAPSPTPTPAASFNTAEYRRSDGPQYHNAIPAWQQGATGRGVTIGIVDTGIDTDSPEFAGRISPASADVAGNGTVEDVGGHGTTVALVAAAARDNTGIVGIAYESTILMLRADSPGSCNSDDDCAFYDTEIARGIDRAVQNGARIINLSLGGSSPESLVTGAIQRAAAAGVLVVVAAGNDADDPDSTIDPTQPDPFAIGVRAAGAGNVIIAGSVDSAGQLSAFSNRAGQQADGYLAALGEDVCCVYENGQIKTTTDATGTYVYVVSGTSFSAPQIAGAAALLIQAFPNLTGAQVVDLLLRTARDAGASGTDTVYGRGILDIANAFAPQGTLALAGSSRPLALGAASIATSSAMGDAAARAPALRAIELDSYRRAYTVNLAQSLRGGGIRPSLGLSLAAPLEQVGGGGQAVSLAFSIDRSPGKGRGPWRGQLRLTEDDARDAAVLAARMIARLTPDTTIAFGFAQGADSLAAQVRGADRPAFLVARAPADDLGFADGQDMAIALRRTLGPWGLTLGGERGAIVSPRLTDRIAGSLGQSARPSYVRFGLGLDRRWGDVDTAAAAHWLAEDRTVLGAQLNDALAGRGADSLFLDLDAGWRPVPGWRLGGAWRQGFTRARAGGFVASGSTITSNGWSLDLARAAVFQRDDSIALRVSQPLRVSSGGLGLALPVAYSYDTLAPTVGVLRLPLTPHGREVAAELAWRGALWGGSASASLFYRKDPGHYAALSDDQGAALTWRTGF